MIIHKIWYLFLILLLSLLIIFYIKNNFNLKEDKLVFLNKNIEVQIEKAITNKEKKIGLSNRIYLDKNAGMLFIFEIPSKYGIWMKDTLIPLDIIFINKNNKIVYIKHRALPKSYFLTPPKIFYPPEDVLFILEVNAGFSKENKIIEGDYVEFSV